MDTGCFAFDLTRSISAKSHYVKRLKKYDNGFWIKVQRLAERRRVQAIGIQNGEHPGHVSGEDIVWSSAKAKAGQETGAVLARLCEHDVNPAQLYESELNFIADKVAEQMRVIAKKEGILLDAYDHMLSFLDLVAPQQAEWMRANVSTDDAVNVALEIIDGKESIYIHQPPFFGNVSLEQLKAAYEKFEVEKEWFVGIEEPLILGTNYYMKLRHEPVSKLSARSAKHLSIGGVPTKNSRGVRTNTEHHSTTPIRLGEQELQNLLIANAPDELKRLLRLYATDDVSREGVIQELLLRGDPFSSDRIEPRGSGTTRPVAGLKALLESIGLRLETGEDGDTAPVMTATMEINEDEETATDQPPGE